MVCSVVCLASYSFADIIWENQYNATMNVGAELAPDVLGVAIGYGITNSLGNGEGT